MHLSWLLENQLKCIQKLLITLHKKCSYSKLFWSAFFHIRTEYLFENPLTCKLPKRSSVTEVAQALFSTFTMPVNECFWFTMHLNCRIYCVEKQFFTETKLRGLLTTNILHILEIISFKTLGHGNNVSI